MKRKTREGIVPLPFILNALLPGIPFMINHVIFVGVALQLGRIYLSYGAVCPSCVYYSAPGIVPQEDPYACDTLLVPADGFTPLMLASFCGGALEPMPAEEDEADDTSASIISDLICQGAQLGARTDRTGETALHLAARYARADAAKRLLDAGADTNAQDHSGRTPLHTAVTADAQGVFQVRQACLFRLRSCCVGVRSTWI